MTLSTLLAVNNKISSGTMGEKRALTYMKSMGFSLLEKNYRYKRSEVDLILTRDNLLVFVEVKFRKSDLYGKPEEFVSENQKKKIIEAADHYIHQSSWNGNIRFDIISINSKLDIEHFEDAFY